CPGGAKASAPARLGALALVQKPALHRGKPGGGEEGRALALVQKPALHRDKPGGGEEGRALALVQKPPLHRDKPGGGEEGGARASCAEASAPPGQARWG